MESQGKFDKALAQVRAHNGKICVCVLKPGDSAATSPLNNDCPSDYECPPEKSMTVKVTKSKAADNIAAGESAVNDPHATYRVQSPDPGDIENVLDALKHKLAPSSRVASENWTDLAPKVCVRGMVQPAFPADHLIFLSRHAAVGGARDRRFFLLPLRVIHRKRRRSVRCARPAAAASNPVRQALATYLHIAGIETGYGYFAPNVPGSYKLVFELHYPDGRVEYELPSVSSAAAGVACSRFAG